MFWAVCITVIEGHPSEMNGKLWTAIKFVKIAVFEASHQLKHAVTAKIKGNDRVAHLHLTDANVAPRINNDKGRQFLVTDAWAFPRDSIGWPLQRLEIHVLHPARGSSSRGLPWASRLHSDPW